MGSLIRDFCKKLRHQNAIPLKLEYSRNKYFAIQKRCSKKRKRKNNLLWESEPQADTQACLWYQFTLPVWFVEKKTQ